MTYKAVLKARLNSLTDRRLIGYEITIVVLLAACVLLAFYAHSATQLQAERIASDCLTHGRMYVDGIGFSCGNPVR